MQHALNVPTITAEEAVNLAWFSTSAETMKAVRELYASILSAPSPITTEGEYRFMLNLTALWNAGRVQGIREERARQRRKEAVQEACK